MLDKLGGVFAPKPSPGPHKQRECLPLCLILRNRLKYALTYKEVTTILQQRLVKVDGKTRRDKCYPTGIMDVVSIDKTDEHFRIIYDQKGRFVVHRITALEAQVRTRAASARVFFGAGGRAAHACGFFGLGRVSKQRSVARCASEFRADGIAVGATGSVVPVFRGCSYLPCASRTDGVSPQTRRARGTSDSSNRRNPNVFRRARVSSRSDAQGSIASAFSRPRLRVCSPLNFPSITRHV